MMRNSTKERKDNCPGWRPMLHDQLDVREQGPYWLMMEHMHHATIATNPHSAL